MVQAQLPTIGKSQTADTGKYKYTYAGLGKIHPVVLPLLAANGLAWTTKPTYVLREDGSREFVLVYRLRHVAGEVDEGEWPLPDPMHATPQQIGSAITYLKRYALCAVVGIAPDEDDDDAQAAQGAPPPARRQTRTPQAPPPVVVDPDPATTTNVTKLALAELNNVQRPAFATWLNHNLHCGMNAVPNEHVEAVEKAIQHFATGVVPGPLEGKPEAVAEGAPGGAS